MEGERQSLWEHLQRIPGHVPGEIPPEYYETPPDMLIPRIRVLSRYGKNGYVGRTEVHPDGTTYIYDKWGMLKKVKRHPDALEFWPTLVDVTILLVLILALASGTWFIGSRLVW